MNRHGHLWAHVTDWENLLVAYKKARRGKSGQKNIRQFGFDLEWELADIRQELLTRTYQPGSFHQFQVRDRKIRLISAAPFRDRVVQHALMNVVEPLVDRRFIFDTYASRRGKGVHAAVRRYQMWAKRYAYTLKMDIQRYFDSIDHRLLKLKLSRQLADAEVLWLFGQIIDHGPLPVAPNVIAPAGEDLVDRMLRPTGLPLGNITSQFFGNLYLNDLDHYIKENLKVTAYFRYVDDLVLLADDKTQLWDWCASIQSFLAAERLGIHPRKCSVYPVGQGEDILGYRVFPDFVRLGRRSGYRFQRKLKRMAHAYHAGKISMESVNTRVAGWLGHARQADTLGLCEAILKSVDFA